MDGYATKVKVKGKKDEEYQKAWNLVEAAQKKTEPNSRKAGEAAGGPREASRRD